MADLARDTAGHLVQPIADVPLSGRRVAVEADATYLVLEGILRELEKLNFQMAQITGDEL